MSRPSRLNLTLQTPIAPSGSGQQWPHAWHCSRPSGNLSYNSPSRVSRASTSARAAIRSILPVLSGTWVEMPLVEECDATVLVLPCTHDRRAAAECGKGTGFSVPYPSAGRLSRWRLVADRERADRRRWVDLLPDAYVPPLRWTGDVTNGDVRRRPCLCGPDARAVYGNLRAGWRRPDAILRAAPRAGAGRHDRQSCAGVSGGQPVRRAAARSRGGPVVDRRRWTTGVPRRIRSAVARVAPAAAAHDDRHRRVADRRAKWCVAGIQRCALVQRRSGRRLLDRSLRADRGLPWFSRLPREEQRQLGRVGLGRARRPAGA